MKNPEYFVLGIAFVLIGLLLFDGLPGYGMAAVGAVFFVLSFVRDKDGSQRASDGLDSKK